MRSNLYTTLFLLMLAFMPAFAAHLTGRVLSPSKTPLSGAVIVLSGAGMYDTTGPDGRFSFITDQATLPPCPSLAIPVRLTGRGMFVWCPGMSKLTIDIYDIKGRRLFRTMAYTKRPPDPHPTGAFPCIRRSAIRRSVLLLLHPDQRLVFLHRVAVLDQ
jgi:hypothetical protein